MTANEILNRFKNVKKQGDGYLVCCPAHDDNMQSLSINDGDKKILLKCHRGCETSDILAKIGLNYSDLFHETEKPKSTSRIVATYDYVDLQGDLIHQTVRKEPKQFLQRRPDGNGGWMWSLKGIETILYNLRNLTKAIDEKETIYIVEGEKDVENMASIGLIATTNSGGGAKWKKSYNEYFKNANVIILPDNDETGIKHSETITQELQGIAGSIKTVLLPDLPAKGDVSDFIAIHGKESKNLILDIVNRTPITTAIPINKVEFTKDQKRDYAINKRVNADADVLERLMEINPCGKYQLCDKGFGELFADIFVDECRYNVTCKEWFVYNGKTWVIDTGSMVVSGKAKKMYDALLKYATTIHDDDQKKIYLETVMKYGALNKRQTMITDARDKFFISNADLDSRGELFNCQNGTYNLDTFTFHPHNSHDLLSKISNIIYDPTADGVEWKKFIDAIMQNDNEKIRYLQKILSYGITTETMLETAFILYGATTRNGKSTLVETFAYMLGNSAGYALNMLPQTLAQKQNNDSRQANGDIARLKGCRFLNASEPPKRMMFDVALLKTLLGRDSITARHLHEREFEFIPCFKLFINTNFLPLITDDTLFTSGRINVITFDKHFSETEQDKGLKDRLKKPENLSGIFNWLIEGLKMFRLEGATPPDAVRNSTQEYRSNSDKVGNFISECLEKTGKNSKASEVYVKYASWCELNGFGTENKSNFFDELKSKNLLRKTGSVKGTTYQNIVANYEIIEGENTGDKWHPWD